MHGLHRADGESLMKEAAAARERSYCPYSGYAVGAALLAEDGRVYRGCNIENAAFSPTVCAERTAFFKAVSEGVKSFKAIAVSGGPAGDPPAACTPCGVCRQVMAEFCDPESFEVFCLDARGRLRDYLLKELLPEGFGAAALPDGEGE